MPEDAIIPAGEIAGGVGNGNNVGSNSGNGGNIINVPSDAGASCFEISSTFYIPFYQQGYFSGDYSGIYYRFNTPKSCDTMSINEGDQIAIYRFTLPADSNNLNSWFLNDLKNQIGNGFLDPSTNSYWTSSDVGPIATLPSSICSGTTCQIKDVSAPEDSYVVYGAKIIGNYTGSGENTTSGDEYISFNCPSKPNKFLKKDNPGGGVVVPDEYSSIGNMFNGPYKTESCRPTIDLKINGNDGVDYNIYYPNNNAQLKWATMRVSGVSGIASGNWSGSKTITGIEELGKLPRGTSNPGQGKKYTYDLTFNPIYKDSPITISDTVSVTVFKKPDCIFSANPSVIEVLPATSTLSWDCRYFGGASDEGSDSCSINQGIGDVNPVLGSMSVRPDKETTYTLTCNAIDGSKDYQASINIGFKPRVYEVTPSY